MKLFNYNKRGFIVFMLVIAGLLFFNMPTFAEGDFSSDLRKMIDEKAAVLQQLENQRKEIEGVLGEISASNNKLAGEINYFDKTIDQLDVIVQSNEITVEKLELEIESLKNDIVYAENKVDNKKKTVSRLFTELQQKGKENLLTIFLKNQSLSDAVGEVQTLSNLNNSLFVNIRELVALQEELVDKINEESNKKESKKIESINLKYRQDIIEDQKKEKQAILAETKNQEKIYEAQLNELKELQDAVSEEIDAIENELRKTINPNLLPLPRSGVLLWPVPEGKLTQAYGNTAFAKKNYKSGWHNGIDVGRFLGAEIVSAEDGIVINSGNQDLYCKGGAYGKFVVVKHTNGLTTLYGHMSRYIVSVGQQVKRGEVIGYMGRTGWATGPHLHFTVFASQTLTPAKAGYPEGTQSSRSCGPMPVGGDLDPFQYLDVPSK